MNGIPSVIAPHLAHHEHIMSAMSVTGRVVGSDDMLEVTQPQEMKQGLSPHLHFPYQHSPPCEAQRNEECRLEINRPFHRQGSRGLAESSGSPRREPDAALAAPPLC